MLMFRHIFATLIRLLMRFDASHFAIFAIDITLSFSLFLPRCHRAFVVDDDISLFQASYFAFAAMMSFLLFFLRIYFRDICCFRA